MKDNWSSYCDLFAKIDFDGFFKHFCSFIFRHFRYFVTVYFGHFVNFGGVGF